MDNLTSSPQLVFPNVPDDFCPSGNWTEVFQAFVDEVLVNGTINVPGLGDVTPAQITSINDQLQAQQNEIDALDTKVDAIDARVETLENDLVSVRTGTVGITPGDSTEAISFSSSLPSANYGVNIQPVGTATTAAAGKYILATGQTTNGFTIRINDNPSTVTSLRWMAIHQG
jgi:polyhydroxyalkanoate synthesis regulator phasin